MQIINRKDIPGKVFPGRTRWPAFGSEEAAFQIDDASVGFARFSLEAGPMEPHKHENEILYVLDCKDAFMLYGDTKDVQSKQPLQVGDIFRMKEGEWHCFSFENQEGYLEMITFYATADRHVVTASMVE